MNDIQKIGCERLINREFAQRGREDVILWDVFPVADGEYLRVIFESISSELRQGLWLRTDQGILINGLSYHSLDLWYDTAPREVVIECHTCNGYLSVYNIFDLGRSPGRMSQTASSGMLVEELVNGRRYRCNDVGFDTNFEKLIFRIERIIRSI